MKKKLFWGSIICFLLIIGAALYMAKQRFVTTVNIILGHTMSGHVEMKTGKLVVDFYNREIDIRNISIQGYLDTSKTNALFFQCKEINVSFSEIGNILKGYNASLKKVEIIEPDVKLLLIKKEKQEKNIDLPKLIEKIRASPVFQHLPEKMLLSNASVLVKNKNGVQFIQGINGTLYGSSDISDSLKENDFLSIRNAFIKNNLKSNWLLAHNIKLDRKVSLQIAKFIFKSNAKTSAIDSIFVENGYFNFHSYFTKNTLGNIKIDTAIVSKIYALVDKKYVVQEISHEKSSSHISSDWFQSFLLKHAILRDFSLNYKDQKNKQELLFSKIGLTIEDAYIDTLKQPSCKRITLLQDSIILQSPDKKLSFNANIFSFVHNGISILSPEIKISTRKLTHVSDVRIKVKELSLSDIQLEALFEKHLYGDKIIIKHPEIYIHTLKKQAQKLKVDELTKNLISKLQNIGQKVKAKVLFIQEAKLEVNNIPKKSKLLMEGMNVTINIEKTLHSANAKNIKKSIDKIIIPNITFSNPKNIIRATDTKIFGSQELNTIESLVVNSRKIRLNGKQIVWQKLDWDALIFDGKVHVEEAKIKSVSFIQIEKSKEKKSNPTKLQDKSLYIGNLDIENVQLTLLVKASIKPFTIRIKELKGSSISYANEVFQWQSLNLSTQAINLNLHKIGKFSLQQLVLKNNQLIIKNIDINAKEQALKIDKLLVQIPKNEIDLHQLQFNKISLEDAYVSYKSDSLKWEAHMNFDIDNLNPNLQAFKTKLTLKTAIDALGKNASTSLNVKLKNLVFIHPKADISLSNAHIYTNKNTPLSLLKNLPKKPLPLIQNFHLALNGFKLRNNKSQVQFAELQFHPKEGTLKLEGFSLEKNKSCDDLIEADPYQNVCFKVLKANLLIKGIDLNKLMQDTLLACKTIEVKNSEFWLQKDKRKPMQNLNEKEMFTHLIQQAPILSKIDNVELTNCILHYHEISLNTAQHTQIALNNIQGKISNIVKNPSKQDSLYLLLSLNMNGIPIDHFSYKESYKDSLHGYRINMHTRSFALNKLSSVTKTVVALEISNGTLDTLHYRVVGNKHACSGEMNFYYNNLEIKKLDKHDEFKKSFLLNALNYTANHFVLKKENHKKSRIFFIRNKQKFIINVWIQSLLRGIFSSAGIKSDRKYNRQFNKLKKQYHLPSLN
jgi:hypothetical protein